MMQGEAYKAHKASGQQLQELDPMRGSLGPDYHIVANLLCDLLNPDAVKRGTINMILDSALFRY